MPTECWRCGGDDHLARDCTAGQPGQDRRASKLYDHQAPVDVRPPADPAIAHRGAAACRAALASRGNVSASEAAPAHPVASDHDDPGEEIPDW
jgi:hypothetical protein